MNPGRARRSPLRRALREIRESLKYLLFAAVFFSAMLAVFLSSMLPRYEQVEDQIVALASVCTHLGCTPNWLEGEQKFKCPCHGSGFYINGINFEGPAPRPLERVGVQLASDGTLEVDKAVKFQEEKGQWEDAKSFVDGSIA